MSAPLVRIPVGVIVERSKSASQWADYYWRPSGLLTGLPDAEPWSVLSKDGNRTLFYAGAASVDLYPSETAHYLNNLSTNAPQLWVVLRPATGEPPYELATVTADPFEGEAMTEAGNQIVDTVPMPKAIQDAVEAFVLQNHVEQPAFFKRKRDRAHPETLGRRNLVDED